MTEGHHKPGERKAELEKCETKAAKTLTEAMEAVRGEVEGCGDLNGGKG